MSGDPEDALKAMRRRLPTGPAEYEVGYGKPPAATRFRKGRSGNPRGRPKGAKKKLPSANAQRLNQIILDEAYRTIGVNEGGATVSYTMAEAVMRSVAVNAAKGRARSQELFTKILSSVERERDKNLLGLFESALNYKIAWEQELKDQARTGRRGQQPPVHPDDVHIGYRSGVVRFAITEDERRLFALICENRPLLLEEKDALREELEAETDPEARKEIEGDLKTTQHALNLIEQILPE